MINKIILSNLLLLYSCLSFGRQVDYNDSISNALNRSLQEKEKFLKLKENKIDNIKQLLDVNGLSDIQKFDINDKIGDAYKKYMTDSAVVYVKKNIAIANKLQNDSLLFKSNIDLAWLYSVQGLYIEAEKILNSINPKKLSDNELSDYYEVYSSFLSHYGQSNDQEIFYKESELYRDSLLSILDKESILYKTTLATKYIYDYQGEKGQTILLNLLDQNLENSELALVSYLLGIKYKFEKDTELQKKFFTIAAIADLQNGTRDNAALQELALVYFNEGNINQALLLIEEAINEALESNVRFRAIETSSFYPIINTLNQEKDRMAMNKMKNYLIIISVAGLLLLIGLLHIYKQMKRLSRIRKELSNTNNELKMLNISLNTANLNLKESNYIKEEYIAHFFDICSSYITKLEDYRKNLNKLAMNNKLEDLFKTLKSTTFIDSEKDELYRNFDQIFLSLYPSFVEDFNALLNPDEQMILKPGENLNTELRIFALIRLGITDSLKIAAFLRYSLRTVYNYRTKMRNRSAGSRELFEDKVKEIGSVHI